MNKDNIPGFGDPPFLDLDEYERRTGGGISDAGEQAGLPVYNVLFLCDYARRNTAGTIIDHCESFRRYSRHKYFYLNPVWSNKPKWMDVNHYDIIIIHYSIYTLGDTFLSPNWRAAIQSARCRKVMFIQDEYRCVNDFIEKMKELRIDVLYTCCPRGEISKLYPQSALADVKKVNTLTGYVPQQLADNPPDFDAIRSVDVGYRGREIGYWLGGLAQEKRWIGERFLAFGREYGLKCDISSREQDRIYGKAWTKFLRSCYCVLGTESGASIVDFTGDIERNVRAYLQERPEAGFEEVHGLFFKDEEGKVRMNQISPRVFESIACGACLILFEGEYSGILKPWVHYMPLKKDFSNIEQIVTKIRDRDYTRAMAKVAYEDVVASGRYSHEAFARKFDRELDVLFRGKQTSARVALANVRGWLRMVLRLLLICASLPVGFLAWIALHGTRIIYKASRCLVALRNRCVSLVRRLVSWVRGRISHVSFRLGRHPVFLKEYFRILIHAVRSSAHIEVHTFLRLDISSAERRIRLRGDVGLRAQTFTGRLLGRWLAAEPGYAWRTCLEAEGLRLTRWSHGQRQWRMYELEEDLWVLCDEMSSRQAGQRMLCVVAPPSFQVHPLDDGFIFTAEALALRGDVLFSKDVHGNVALSLGRRSLSMQSRQSPDGCTITLSPPPSALHAVWVIQASREQPTKPVITVLQDDGECRVVRIKVGDKSYLLLDRDLPKRRDFLGCERIPQTGWPIAIQYAGEEIDVIWAMTNDGLVRFG